jgi:hypothetical protein
MSSEELLVLRTSLLLRVAEHRKKHMLLLQTLVGLVQAVTKMPGGAEFTRPALAQLRSSLDLLGEIDRTTQELAAN